MRFILFFILFCSFTFFLKAQSKQSIKTIYTNQKIQPKQPYPSVLGKKSSVKELAMPKTLAQHRDYVKRINLRQTLRAISPFIRKQMREHAVPGLQLTLLRAKRKQNVFLHKTYGYADTQKKQNVHQHTLFPGSGNMPHWPIAYALLKQLAKQKQSWREILYDPQSVTNFITLFSLDTKTMSLPNLHQLLTMTSGLPVWQLPYEGIHHRQLPVSIWQMNAKSGSRIQFAPQSYIYLSHMLGNAIQTAHSLLALNTLLEKEIKLNGLMRQSCLQIENCKQSRDLSIPMHGIPRAKSAKTSFFSLPVQRQQYPIGTVLYTNSNDYSLFLAKLWQQAQKDPHAFPAKMLQIQFQYNERLGGMGYASFVSRPVYWFIPNKKSQAKKKYRAITPNDQEKNNALSYASTVFYSESSLPGYAGLAFLNYEQGLGAVLFINKNDLFFLRRIQKELYIHWYIINNDEDIKKQTQKNLAGIHNTSEIFGSYRPLASVPRKQQSINFLNELQLRYTGKAIELSSVFEKGVVIRLIPYKDDLYIARGLAQMDHWRVLLKRDRHGKIIGIDTDRMRYQRVPKWFSAQSIIIMSGILVGLPLFLALFYFIYCKNAIKN